MHVRTCSVLAVLLVSGLPGWGQQAPADLEKELMDLLNTPVTGASKREQRLIDSPQAIEVLTGDEIRQMGIYRVQDALKLMTSIDVIEAGNGYSVIGMRGVMQEGQPRTVQILIDGVPLYMPMGGSVDINNLPLPVDLIERIEVVRGPSSTLYGANAVVGVIAITTKKLDAGTHGDLRASAANMSTARGAADIRYQANGFGVLAGYSGASFGDSGERSHQLGMYNTYPNPLGGTINPWITFDGSTAAGHGTDKAHQGAAFARAEYRGEATSLWFSAGQSHKSISPAGLPPVTYINYRFYDINTLLAGWGQTWSKTFRTELRVHRMQNQVGAGPSPVVAIVEADPGWNSKYTWGDMHSDQVDLQANWNPSADLHFVFGADTRSMHFEKDVQHGLLAPTKESASGAFASVDWNLAQAHVLSLGVRAENESLGGSRTSPRAAYVWKAGPNSVLRFAFLTSTRSPQYLEEHNNNLAHLPVAPAFPIIFTIQPNLDLKPEKTTDFEIGFRHVMGAVTLDATVYQMKLSDLINQEITSINVYPSPPYPAGLRRVNTMFQNTGNAKNTGAEVAATWVVQKGWTTGLNLGYLKFKKDNPSATDPLGDAFAYAPQTKANAWTRFTFGKWSGYGAVQYMSHTDVEALYALGQSMYDKRDAILQFHLNLGWEILPGLTASAYLRNGAREFTEQGATGPDRPPYYLSMRREYGGTLAYRF